MQLNYTNKKQNSWYINLHKNKLYVFTTIVLFSILQLPAQNTDLRFSYITTQNGLSNNIVNCIGQDNYGFIWIGTMEGLNRYDGYNNTVFKKVLGDTTSIADNMIYKIYIDCFNNILVGTQNGLCIYNPDPENFTTVIPDPLQIQINTANRVTGIAENTTKQLFVTVELGSLFEFNMVTQKFIPDTNSFVSIRDFLIDKNDIFWLGGDNGLYAYNKKNGAITHFNQCITNNQVLPINKVNTIFEEGDTIWIGTTLGRIFYVLKSTMQVHLLQHNFEQTYFVYDIYKPSDGLFYVSTTDGLFLYDKTDNTYTAYRYQKDNPNGLKSFGVTTTFQDRQGNIWLGTYQGGINLSIKGKPFYNYNQYSASLTLDVENIKTIMQDHESRIWIGSFNTGVNVVEFKNNKKQLFMPNPNNPDNSLGAGSVHSIFEDSKNQIWVGTYVSTLKKYNPLTNNFTPVVFYDNDKTNVISRDVRSIAEDKNNNLWIVAHGNGIIKYNINTGQYTQLKRDFNNIATTLADDYAFHLIIDHKNYIWVATPSGLSGLDPKTNIFTNYFNQANDTNSLCNNFVNTVFEDGNQNLWIGTNYGLDMFDRNNNIFHHLYDKHGLPSNQIKGILENKPGELWITTGVGLSRLVYDYDTINMVLRAAFRNYNKFDNIQDEYFWEQSGCKLNNGNIAIGGETGLTIFNPDDIHDNETVPLVYLTNFKLFNNKVIVNDNTKILTRNILNTSLITLKHNQNFITFEYVAINYIAREKNQFKYKLEGFDADWVMAGNKREASYTNLSPGKYVFKVIASNNDNKWNYTGAQVEVVVLPPFYKTWLFRIILFLLIGGIIVMYLFRQQQIYLQQKSLLEKMVQKRTQELIKLNDELIDKNLRISAQNEEITTQSEELQAKGNEIYEQKQKLEKQKEQIEQAYEELKIHRSQLEELVEQRTHELIIAKDKAEESDRLKTSFLTNMSHEIRTPLNSIIGFSNLLSEGLISDNERDNIKNIIQVNSQLLLGLIHDIIDFSKIESGQFEIYKSSLQLSVFLQSIKNIYDVEATKILFSFDKKIEFRTNFDSTLNNISIITDQIRVNQVFAVLINNAIKFTRQGFIEVGCYVKDDNFVEFYVKDTGIGIDKRYHNAIFERFRKIEDDISKLYSGTGLGLSIVQKIVNLLGGQIKVESELGKGAAFYFTAAIDHNPAGALVNQISNNNTEKKQTDLSGVTILVAEDDEANFIFIERLLSKYKATVLHAANGAQVIEILDKTPDVKLILMDIKMPVMNGVDALLLLRNKNYTMPVIAQTAYAFASEIQQILRNGFTDYISKPINSTVLLKLINKYL